VGGPHSQVGPVTALSLSGSNLPTFYLEIPDESLRRILESIYENQWVGAQLTPPDNISRSVRARIRGGITRLFQKNSFKIRLPSDQPYDNRSVLNLAWKADATYMREPLTYDLFRRVGIPSSRVSFLHLVLNGESQGVFLDIEAVDEEFLEARSLDSDGSLYEAEGGNMELSEDPADYARLYDKKFGDESDLSDIIGLVELVNLTPPDEFPQAIWDALDVEQFLDWYAIVILTANRDIVCGNHFFYRPRGEARWTVLPWDNDLAFPRYHARRLPLDMGAEGSEPPVSGGTNRLITRILEVDGFRYLYAEKLSQYMADLFQPQDLEQQVDSLLTLIQEDAFRDRLKMTWEDNEAFLNEVEEIKTFVQHRREYVQAELSFWRPPESDVRINEIHRDESGSNTWIEIWNGGVGSVSTEELILSDRPITGTGYPLGTSAIAPGGHYVVALTSAAQEADGFVSIDFKGGKRCLALYRREAGAMSLVDVAIWPPYMSAGTLARSRDGAYEWTRVLDPTPGWSNGEPAPPETVGGAGVMVFPSPAREDFTIRLRSVEPSQTRLELYDPTGRCLRELPLAHWARGESTATWESVVNVGLLPSGIYLLRLSGAESVSRTIVVIR
ncbi:CotH kinase family protein, partial [Candidatus Eisenbacteria bacterium]